jgi:hypothetical protein
VRVELERLNVTLRAAACCAHLMSEHGDDGCLNGWDQRDGEGFAIGEGCPCRRMGTADRG